MALFDRRLVLLSAAGAALTSPASAQPIAIAPPDATVGPGGYGAVSEALAAAPGDGARPWRILITPGRWREKLVIDKPNITLVGQDRASCVLTYDDASRTPKPEGGTTGTSGSYAIAIRAPDVSLQNLTIENAFDYDAAARAAAGGDQQAAGGLQAVALMLGEGAERTWVDGCDINGHQDTLFANRGRAYFRRCRITGTVEFIFGAARALFQQCDIVSRARPDAQGRWGWVSAASTPRGQYYGFAFNRCRLTKEPSVPQRSVGLGRFWRPTRDFPDGRYGDPEAAGASVFLYCWLGDHIIAEGWDPMGYNAQGGGRAQLTPHEARPAEYASRGPGARARPFQLSQRDAHIFAPERVLGGWLPAPL